MIGCDTVVFDVGGTLFKTLRRTVMKHPQTLLACLLDDIGTDSQQPIFVDASAARFAHLLDWYRYGEIFAGGCPLEAVLRDADFFNLPDTIKVDGQWHSTVRRERLVDADADVTTHSKLSDEAFRRIVESWPSVRTDLITIIGKVEQHFAVATQTGAGRIGDSGLRYAIRNKAVVPPAVVKLEDCFQDGKQCTKARGTIIVSELEKLGFESDIKPDREGTNVIVTLHVTRGPVGTAKSLSATASHVNADMEDAMRSYDICYDRLCDLRFEEKALPVYVINTHLAPVAP
eukprot:TRINITY_DN15984_c0_g1_i1.p1 TRINITY_DN15984_c0_g1~~TRINITY_DN15984_c0_g1_i1.p1  ORF type:complete len:288 (+),score=33.10 TRINITY_DN15984_c0_g1_i1:198-1061(+)